MLEGDCAFVSGIGSGGTYHHTSSRPGAAGNSGCLHPGSTTIRGCQLLTCAVLSAMVINCEMLCEDLQLGILRHWKLQHPVRWMRCVFSTMRNRSNVEPYVLYTILRC